MSTMRVNKKEYRILLNSLSDMLYKLTEKMQSTSDDVAYYALANMYDTTERLYNKIEKLEVL